MKETKQTNTPVSHTLSTRNVVYSILALALISSYIYINTQTRGPLVASAQESKLELNAQETKKRLTGASSNSEKLEDD